jgi:hypothetical protein
MFTTLPVPPQFVSFHLPQLDTKPPLVKPPLRLGFGDYCIKATVDVKNLDGNVIGTFVGYDRNYQQVTEETENACIVHQKKMRKNRTHHTCAPTTVTYISGRASEGYNCKGELYFILGETVKLLNPGRIW